MELLLGGVKGARCVSMDESDRTLSYSFRGPHRPRYEAFRMMESIELLNVVREVSEGTESDLFAL
jgi:hypothetical protein